MRMVPNYTECRNHFWFENLVQTTHSKTKMKQIIKAHGKLALSACTCLKLFDVFDFSTLELSTIFYSKFQQLIDFENRKFHFRKQTESQYISFIQTKTISDQL